MGTEEVEFEDLREVLEKSEAYAAMVFGSYARGEDFNDVDVAVFIDGSVEPIVKEASGVFDISRFSDLPMYIRKRVLGEGEVIYVEDEDKLYDTVLDFIRRYEDFEPVYIEYISGVKARG